MKRVLFIYLYLFLTQTSNGQNGPIQKGNNNIQINNPKGNVIINNYYKYKDFNKSDFNKLLISFNEMKASFDSIKNQSKELKKLIISINNTEKNLIPDSVNASNTKFYSLEKLCEDSNSYIPLSIKNKVVIIKKNNKYGLMDDKGTLRLDYKYDFIDFNGDTNLIAVSRNNSGYYINLKEKLILKIPEANIVFSFNDSLARVVINGKFGLIKKDGSFVISPKFDNMHPFENGLASVSNNTKKGGWLSGVINTKGDMIIPLGYHNIGQGLYAKTSKSGLKSNTKWGWILIDKKGNVLLKGDKKSKGGIPSISEAPNNLILVRISGSSRLFDSTGKVIMTFKGFVTFISDSILSITTLQTYNKKLKRWITKAVLIDLNGQIVLDNNFNTIEQIKDSFFIASHCINNKIYYGVVNINGLEILPFIFSNFRKFSDGQFIGRKSACKKDENKKNDNNCYIVFNNNFQCVKRCELLNTK